MQLIFRPFHSKASVWCHWQYLLLSIGIHLEGFPVKFNIVRLLLEAVAMRRQTDSLVSDGKEHFPSRNSSMQKADQKLDGLDPDGTDSDKFIDLDATGDNLPENVMLESKLDQIFADVASKLPSVDFDISDVRIMLI